MLTVLFHNDFSLCFFFFSHISAFFSFFYIFGHYFFTLAPDCLSLIALHENSFICRNSGTSACFTSRAWILALKKTHHFWSLLVFNCCKLIFLTCAKLWAFSFQPDFHCLALQARSEWLPLLPVCLLITAQVPTEWVQNTPPKATQGKFTTPAGWDVTWVNFTYFIKVCTLERAWVELCEQPLQN